MRADARYSYSREGASLNKFQIIEGDTLVSIRNIAAQYESIEAHRNLKHRLPERR